ncbi:uncharacterized protein BDV17DRAFT_115838 [Aspergillus undulatus]|uniref:uncharacterized protein n=1 Tax=Aspergillus undulatus TaxID=1810928 RepID=UPI003CCE40CC
MPPLRPLPFIPRSLTFRLHPPPRRHLSRSSNVWHVKVKRSLFRGSVTKYVLVAAVLFWSSFVAIREDIAPDDVEKNDIGADATRRSASEAPLPRSSRAAFLPIGWPRLREGKFYTVSDPEWRKFIEVSKDHKKLEALKCELASIVLDEASQSSLLSYSIGPPFGIVQSWLLPYFPSRAPPVYCRSGLLFTNYGILWTWEQPMSDHRISKFVPPHVVALAVKKAYSVLWESLLDELNASNSDEERSPGLSDASSKTLLPSGFKTLDKLGDASRSESQLLPPSSPRNGTIRNDEDKRPHPSIILSTLEWLPLPKFGPGTDLYAASLAFKQQINECRARESRVHRRGTFLVRGPVGVRGSLGSCRIEVEGEYDPVASEWVSISMHLRDLHLRTKKPLGGL